MQLFTQFYLSTIMKYISFRQWFYFGNYTPLWAYFWNASSKLDDMNKKFCYITVICRLFPNLPQMSSNRPKRKRPAPDSFSPPPTPAPTTAPRANNLWKSGTHQPSRSKLLAKRYSFSRCYISEMLQWVPLTLESQRVSSEHQGATL